MLLLLLLNQIVEIKPPTSTNSHFCHQQLEQPVAASDSKDPNAQKDKECHLTITLILFAMSCTFTCSVKKIRPFSNGDS